MAETLNPSGMPERKPEELRKELVDLVVENQELFADKEYGATLKALIQMKPEQYEGFKQRLTEQIKFRKKHNIRNAAA
jgi:molybdopterin converting factor small subunit